jgi:RNA polymerase sigma-70 factor, ECF subfamily
VSDRRSNHVHVPHYETKEVASTGSPVVTQQAMCNPYTRSTTHGSSTTAETRFLSEALPLRPELSRAARRHTQNAQDAEDLVQETYAKAWAGFESFQPGTNIRAWMYRIMVNSWIGTYHKSERRPKESLTGFTTDAHLSTAQLRRTTMPSAEEQALQHLPSEVLIDAMRALPLIMQTAIYYAVVCQLPLKEIAEIEGIPVGTAMSRVHRARCRLKSMLCDAGMDRDDALGEPRCA